jgi:hypothetical protein
MQSSVSWAARRRVNCVFQPADVRRLLEENLLARPDKRAGCGVHSKRATRDWNSRKTPSIPPPILHVSSNNQQIPLYAPDGTSLGFRALDAAKRLIEGGY